MDASTSFTISSETKRTSFRKLQQFATTVRGKSYCQFWRFTSQAIISVTYIDDLHADYFMFVVPNVLATAAVKLTLYLFSLVSSSCWALLPPCYSTLWYTVQFCWWWVDQLWIPIVLCRASVNFIHAIHFVMESLPPYNKYNKHLLTLHNTAIILLQLSLFELHADRRLHLCYSTK